MTMNAIYSNQVTTMSNTTEFYIECKNMAQDIQYLAERWGQTPTDVMEYLSDILHTDPDIERVENYK